MTNDRLQKYLQDGLKGLLVAAVMAIAVSFPELAFAQDDLGTSATTITGNVGPIAPLISALFWVAGGVMMGAGALKLKEHAENPGQTPMRQGIARMAVGAALLTIPFFSQFVVNTLAIGTTPAGYTPFTSP
jgi:hypothetical protein